MNPGEVLNGRFEILGPLGGDGLGRAWRAQDRQAGRSCTVREVPLQGHEDPQAAARFMEETAVLRRLSHPRIPEFIDCIARPGPEGTRCFLVQDFREGQNLLQCVSAGRHFGEAEVLALGLELCGVLEYLHGQQPPILHGDLRPGNLLLDPQDKPCLIDFGALRAQPVRSSEGFEGQAPDALSSTYIAYEQFCGHAVPASDVHALGMTLLFLLSGKDPASFEERSLKLRFRPQVAIGNAFASVLERAIEPQWEDRHPAAAALRRDLELVRDGQAPAPRPRSGDDQPSAPMQRARRVLRDQRALAVGGCVLLLAGLAYAFAGQFPLLTGPRKQPGTAPVLAPSPLRSGARPRDSEVPVRPLLPAPPTVWRQLADLAHLPCCFQEDREGNVWLRNGEELICYRAGNAERPEWVMNSSLFEASFPGRQWRGAWASWALHPGEVWLGTGDGLVLHRRGNIWNATALRGGGARPPPVCAFASCRDALFLANAEGLWFWDERAGCWGRQASFPGQALLGLCTLGPGQEELVAAERDRVWLGLGERWRVIWEAAAGQELVRIQAAAPGALWVHLKGDHLLRLAPDAGNVRFAAEPLRGFNRYSLSLLEPNGRHWTFAPYGQPPGLAYAGPSDPTWHHDNFCAPFRRACASDLLLDRRGMLWWSVWEAPEQGAVFRNYNALVAPAGLVAQAARTSLAERRRHPVRLRLTWNDRPLAETVTCEPEIRLQGIPGYHEPQGLKWRFQNSEAVCEEVPEGFYSLEVRIGQRPGSRERQPGDLYRQAPYYDFAISAPHPQFVAIPVPLLYGLRLLEPLDNSQPLAAAQPAYGDLPVLKSPLRVRWEVPAEGLHYEVQVSVERQEGQGKQEWRHAGRTWRRHSDGSELTLELSPLPEGQAYTVQVWASGRQNVAYTHFFDEKGNPAACRFRIVGDSGTTPAQDKDRERVKRP